MKPRYVGPLADLFSVVAMFDSAHKYVKVVHLTVNETEIPRTVAIAFEEVANRLHRWTYVFTNL